MRLYKFSSGLSLYTLVLALLLVSIAPLAAQQSAPVPPTEAAQSSKPSAEKEPELPAQIQLLETRVRFEANGDSRKEVHTLVHINNELGVRQFARLNFDYNRSFQQVELPLMRITHASGGTADILPGAISDQPNPAVVNFPAYQDVRVKSIRILGLEPGDTLEYRVVTTTTNHPLAPDFWLDHTFDRSGVVSQEIFELDVPAETHLRLIIGPNAPPSTKSCDIGEVGCATHKMYRWQVEARNDNRSSSHDRSPDTEPDIALSSFKSWAQVATRLAVLLKPPNDVPSSIHTLGSKLEGHTVDKKAKAEKFYDFVSEKIRTVDLSPAAVGFRSRSPEDIFHSGYGTPLDKLTLLDGLMAAFIGEPAPAYLSANPRPEDHVPSPAMLEDLIEAVNMSSPPEQDGRRHGTTCDHCRAIIWLDPALEVAPFGVIRPSLRGRKALLIGGSFAGEGLHLDKWAVENDTPSPWRNIDDQLPFSPVQRVDIEARIGADGTLAAHARYSMRGDSELLLRVAFHQAPKEKWEEVAQLVALADGFRGKVTNVTASDPYATKEPFTVEYEITQPKFVDWSKKPVRIPAILPLMALPDAPKPNGDSASGGIVLGTPLDVQTRVTLRVPPDTSIRAPAGISVDREYATFSSEYLARNLTLTAERRIKFLQREIPEGHAADYAAFVHAVQNDQAQEFTLERASSASAAQTVNSKISAPAAAAKP